MNTAWLQRAFVDLAGKDSVEAQEMLRRWVASRMLSLGDYHELADRLTAAYLERDARRAANAKAAPKSRTGKLPPLGAERSRAKTAKLPPLPPSQGTSTGAPGSAGAPGKTAGSGPLPRPEAAPDVQGPRGPGAGTRPLGGRTEPLDRFRSRPPGSQ